MYEDWKYLEIHIGWFLLLFTGISIYIYWYFAPIGFHFYWPTLLMNSIISLLLFISTIVFISIRKLSVINVIDNYIGLGDIVSIFLIGAWIQTSFFLLTIILSSITGLFIQKIKPTKHIPLATYLIGWALFFYSISLMQII